MQPADPATNRSITEFGSYSFQLEDGEVIQFQGGLANNCGKFAPHDCANWTAAMHPVPGRAGIFSVDVNFLRSRDHGKTQTLNVSTIFAPSSIISLLQSGGLGMSGIIQTEDGSLLAPSYGYSADAIGPPYGKTRTVVLASTSRGRTWSYRSTVAFDEDSDTKALPDSHP